MDPNINRVYVNPNFNRAPDRQAFTIMPTYSNNYMHVNPNFNRHVPSAHQNLNSNRKIYVNPNFIKSTNMSDNQQYSDSELISYSHQRLDDLSCLNEKYYNPLASLPVNIKPLQANTPCPSSKSKYRLVRNNDNRVLNKESAIRETGTIKISKYKSIPLNNFKKSLQIIKNDVTTKQKQGNVNVNLPLQKYVNKSCFKIVKQSLPPINSAFKATPKVNTLKLKRTVDLNSQMKPKVSIATRKKNNMPCRLFTKYGTCLRNLSGSCEYLHDKKHVSLCRKFIKGICHDKGCLLSHELTSKKMPTCYFYLKGMCTKTDCPYLHVKLSEKSKVCHEFLKGYCERGDMCPDRHIRPRENKTSKKNTDNILSKYKFNRTVKVTISKVNKTNLSRRLQSQISRKKTETKYPLNCENGNDVSNDNCRYFKEDLQRDVTCEILKPSRCKLGTLPSFIQLK